MGRRVGTVDEEKSNWVHQQIHHWGGHKDQYITVWPVKDIDYGDISDRDYFKKVEVTRLTSEHKVAQY